MIVPGKDVSSRVIANSPNLITKCQIRAFVYIQKKEALKLTYFKHTCTVKKSYLCRFLCTLTLSIIIYYIHYTDTQIKEG